MCTYIRGARNASVSALSLQVHLHVETRTDKFSLELASSLVHRPNCCFSFGPQAKLECRLSSHCLEQGVFHHGCRYPVLGTSVLVDTGVWNAEELQNHLFFQPWKAEKSRTAWKLRKRHLSPSKALISPASPVLHWGVTHSTHGFAPTYRSGIFLEVALLPFVAATKSQPWRRVVICSIQTH